MSTSGSGTVTTTINLSSVLQGIAAADLALATQAITTAHTGVQSAIASAVVTTAPVSLEVAQAAAQEATNGLISKVVEDAGPELGPLVSAYLPSIIQYSAANFFNFSVGKLFGSASETAAENAETSAGIPN